MGIGEFIMELEGKKYQNIDFLSKEKQKTEWIVADFMCCDNLGYKVILL